MVSLQTSLDCVLSTHLYIFFSSQSPADVYAFTSGSTEILRSENVLSYNSEARTKPAVRAQVLLLICHTITNNLSNSLLYDTTEFPFERLFICLLIKRSNLMTGQDRVDKSTQLISSNVSDQQGMGWSPGCDTCVLGKTL